MEILNIVVEAGRSTGLSAADSTPLPESVVHLDAGRTTLVRQAKIVVLEIKWDY